MTVEEYKHQVQYLREQWKAAMKRGEDLSTLVSQVKQLQQVQESLLKQSLPDFRRKLLNSRDPAVALTFLTAAKDLGESDLKEGEKELCRALLSAEPPDEPQIPEDSQFCFDDYDGMPYLSLFHTHTGFLFLDDGSVILFENNHGWHYRKKPILTDCFAQNAVWETGSSCLILDLDSGIDRLSYRQIATADDLLALPLFAQ